MTNVIQFDSTQSPFDQIKQTREDGTEFWSARDLMPLLGYDRWENFHTSVCRAMDSSRAQGQEIADHFRGATKVITGGRWGSQSVSDFELTRFACYLVAMNGDPRKPEVAAAQAYFAVKTREAETAPALQLPQDYGSALRELAATWEREQQVIAQRDAAHAQIEADAPKVQYVNQYVADSDLMTLRTVASNLGVQEKWLRELLVHKSWIYCEVSSRWSNKAEGKVEVRRYSAYADKKPYFRPIEVHDAPRFRGEVMHTLKVTPAGAEAIARLVAKVLRAADEAISR